MQFHVYLPVYQATWEMGSTIKGKNLSFGAKMFLLEKVPFDNEDKTIFDRVASLTMYPLYNKIFYSLFITRILRNNKGLYFKWPINCSRRNLTSTVD